MPRVKLPQHMITSPKTSRKLPEFTAGDRVAYAAKFLKNIGAFTGETPRRRGTFMSYWSADNQFARVKWDDFEANAAEYAQQNGNDYVDDARANGQCVHRANVAKVGSPRFALNDID